MKLKKFTSIFAATALALGVLAGCGEKSSSDGDGESSSSSKDGGTIKIGLNLELTGAVASYGTSEADGIQLAVDEINEAGGIDGKKIELVKVDNKSEAAEATSGAVKLTTQDKVVAIIGAATSGATVAQAQIANDNETPLISPSGTSPTVTVNEDGSLNEYVFRTSFIDPFQGTVAANFAANELKVKKAAIYSDNSSDYSKGLAKSFKEYFESAGGKTVANESYVAKDSDFRSTLTRIKSANPEFIFIPGYYEEVGLIVKQAREMGIDVPLMGADGWDSPTLLDLAGVDALNNTFTVNHYSSEDPDGKIQDFKEKFKAKYNQSPNAFNALGYDTVYLLKDAIERAGEVDSKKIKEELEKTDGLELITGLYSVDENHHPIKSATILEFQDGEQVFKTKVDP
ncbi:ethanolamine utilization protein EutJ [Siminovitchia terrae]|uniref:Ethanolamine utilization protein EutJ n=1 Tax=Siminovitchia terrae TaxID=1914933 RepID=A0ABQ4KZI9_SIMTE|nr:ABC transporter substrate-binding protein [Siminovitchia terrae]GIN92505.1 ethanolamine utilization protein EutJ [Siminovitchia terrae]GIN97107.1 ethanolamine utilization protein EutJ [Siminovitchia terrae]